MITVNGESVEYEEGTTVASLLEKHNFIFPMIVVKINGEPVSRDEYGRAPIADGDRVEVIHMISGG